MGPSFGVTDGPTLAWLVAGFSLTVGTFILFSGRLGDIFGYKRMLLVGFCWFSVWSVVAGLSVYSNYTLAVFSRVLQGIGPALMLPNALAIFGAAYPPGHRKAMVFAFFGAVAPIGAVFGALFGALLSLSWWPWAQWIQAIWLLILAAAGYFIIPDVGAKQALPRGLKDWVLTLDLPGAFVGITALVLFNFAWTQAPISGWVTPVALVPLAISLLLFALFALIESKMSKNPLLPFDTVTVETGFVLVAMVCGWATFGIWTLYLVQVLQDIRGLTPLLTVAWFSPVTISGAVAAVVTGKLLGPWAVRPPIVMTFALAAFTLGAILTATAPTDQIYWGQIFFAVLVMPFGMDMSFPAATLTLSNAVPKHHQGIGASLINTVVNYGIALGVGFAGTVEVHVHHGGETPEDRLKGYRGGLYMGVGLAALGLLNCCVFLVRDFLIHKKR
jgi:MFS family permease